MSDIYRIAVNLAMTSNAPAFLSSLVRQLHIAHVHVKDLEGGLNRLSRIKLAVGGGLAIAGGVAGLDGLKKLVDKGNELVKIQQNMAEAGVKATQVQEAYAKAWELTRKYQNVGAAEVLKVINEGRMTFGDQSKSTEHAEDFIRMISFLKAYQGGSHGGGAANFEAEAVAAMKSGEIAGKITPDEMAEHVKQLTAMRVAYGDQLKITDYLTAQRAGGVALRNSSDAFRYGMFPALVQENGSGAGTMLMTAFNKIVAGTGNRTKSLEHMAEIGVLNRNELEYDKTGRIKGLKNADAMKNSRDAALNFGDWVMKTFKPLIDAKTHDPIKEAQMISSMFPDRNAAKAITEVLQQFQKLSKDAAQMAEARKALDEGGYLDKSWEGQKQAFEEQWNNFLQALGTPLVGVATENLKRLNDAMAGLSQWAAKPENFETIRNIGTGIGILGAALVGGGGVAILAALGPAGWIAAGIIATGAAMVAFKPQLDQFHDWLKKQGDSLNEYFGLSNKQVADAITNFASAVADHFVTAVKSIPDLLSSAISDLGHIIASKIGDAFRSIGSYLGGLLNRTSFDGDGSNGAGLYKTSYETGGYANDNDGSRLVRHAASGAGGGHFGGGGWAGGGSGSNKAFSSAGIEAVRQYIRSRAAALGIDPNIAERVARSEGLNSALGAGGDGGTSDGPYQLHVGGGIGDLYQRLYHRSIHDKSPQALKDQVDFALGYAREHGWGSWYGARNSHIGAWQGIGTYHGQAPQPRFAGPPPKKTPSETHVHNIHIDGKRIAQVVTREQARRGRFPTAVGGIDAHGSFASPGTPLLDVA